MTYKDKMSEAIIDSAHELFLEKSISKVYISDIAKKAGIGEATVYRYFKTKQNLALKVATKEWNNIRKTLDASRQGDGYQRIYDFYNLFSDTFQKHPNFFVFLFEFDQIILTDSTLAFSEYQHTLSEIKMLYDEAYRLGLEDHSIRPVEDIDLYYYTTTHSLLSLCKKMATDNLVDIGLGIDKNKEIQLLIKIITDRLKGDKNEKTK